MSLYSEHEVALLDHVEASYRQARRFVYDIGMTSSSAGLTHDQQRVLAEEIGSAKALDDYRADRHR